MSFGFNKCPRCGHNLYDVNSQSSEKECLQKDCGYTTVGRKTFRDIWKGFDKVINQTAQRMVDLGIEPPNKKGE